MNIVLFFRALIALSLFINLYPAVAQSAFEPVYTPRGGIQQGSFERRNHGVPSTNILRHMREREEERIRRQNAEIRQRFGHTPSPKETYEFTGKPVVPPQLRLENEMKALLWESERNDFIASEKAYYQSKAYLDDLPRYIKARDLIAEMLRGGRDLSVKDAFYLAESAYGDLHLSYEEYSKIIAGNAAFIRQWLRENNYPPRDAEALHMGIQKFMGDTLYIHSNGERKGHLPYYYDFIDPIGKDRRNYFVTKTLATGSGQCHTLPVVYLLLAEALGVEVYMAYNPQHSFIRFRNNGGSVINYETTVDNYLPDAFYMETLPAMAGAYQNSFYIHNLDKRQVVASVLFDLGASFVREHWMGNHAFLWSCIELGRSAFPGQFYISIACDYLHKRLYADALYRKARERGVTRLSDLGAYPDVREAWDRYRNYMEQVAALGIQEMPEPEYMRLMAHYDHKSRLQRESGIDAKSKRNLFF